MSSKAVDLEYSSFLRQYLSLTMSSLQGQNSGFRQTQRAPPGDSNPSHPFDHYDVSQRNALGSPAHAQSPTETPRTHAHSDWPIGSPSLHSQAGYDMLGLSSPACSGPSVVKSCPGVDAPAASNMRPRSSNYAFPITASNTAYGPSAAAPCVPVTRPASSSYPAMTTTDDKSLHAFWATVLGTSNEPCSDDTTTITQIPKPRSPSPSCYTSESDSIASTPQTKSTHLPQKRSTARNHSQRLEAAEKSKSAAVRKLQGLEKRKQLAKERRQTVKETQDMLQLLVYSEEENARFTQPPSQKRIMWDAVARWPIVQRLNQKAVDMDREAKAISETLAFVLELVSRSLREADALRTEVEQKKMRPLDEMNAQAKQILAGLCPRVSHVRQDVKTNIENIANAKAGKY